MIMDFINLPASFDEFSTFDWQQSIKNAVEVTSPATPSVGDRYIIAGIGGLWSTFTINDIVEYKVGGWEHTTPNEGFAAWNEATNSIYVFNGTSWAALTGGIAPIVSSTDHA